MKTTHHTSEIRICTDDFRGDHAGLKLGAAICDVIAKAEATIKANACTLVKYRLDNTPSIDQNPLGDIITITFYIVSDFEATDVKLDVDYIHAKLPEDICCKVKDATIVNLNYKL